MSLCWKIFSFALLHLRINAGTKKRETKKIFQRGALHPYFGASIYMFPFICFFIQQTIKKGFKLG